MKEMPLAGAGMAARIAASGRVVIAGALPFCFATPN